MTPLGFEIRKIRASRGMTLKGHAARIGVSAAYLSSLENGHKGLPTDDMLARIIAALAMTPGEEKVVKSLVRLSNPKVTVDTSGMTPLATEVANRLALQIRELPERDLSEMLWLLHRAQVGPTERN